MSSRTFQRTIANFAAETVVFILLRSHGQTHRPRAQLVRLHLAKHIETEAVDTTCRCASFEDDAPILRRDGISRLHGAHVAFFDGKKRRERRDSDFVDDFFERRQQLPIATPSSDACQDST